VSEDLSGFSLLELFRLESESQTAALSSGLLALDEGEASPAKIEPLMRAAHSLKGAARIVGLDAAVQVAHALEDCFVAAQKGELTLQPEHVDVLLGAVDLLVQISQIPEGGVDAWLAENSGHVDKVVADLASIRAGRFVTAAPEPTEPTTETIDLEPADTPGAELSGAEDLPEPIVATIPASPAAVATVPEPAAEPPVTESPETTSPPGDVPPPATAERVVRVSAESLTRLLGLAGESLVQAGQLRPMVNSLVTLKSRETRLVEGLRALIDRDTTVLTNGEATAWREKLAGIRALAIESLEALGQRIEEFEAYVARSVDLSDRLHNEVLISRMQPLAGGIRGFPRLVRDVARSLGKQVRFEVRGENTGVDRDILEKLEAPLNHLIRNALDHAIEMPEERRAAGKDPTGTIWLEARHRAGMLQVILGDDGRGIDSRQLRVQVAARGLVSGATAQQLTEAELLEFLFLPGFSTKDTVTEISGRGVGLDAVQSLVRSVGGTVRVSTQLGKGTRFLLQLPITRSVIRALLVRVGGEPYAFPLNRIDRLLRVEKSQLRSLEGRLHCEFDGQPVGLVEAAQVLELSSSELSGSDFPVVVVSDRSLRFGVIVEEILGERDLEVRPLDPRLGRVPDINSASILEDGSPVLIVDVEDLVRSIDNLLGGRRLKRPAALAEGPGRRSVQRILVVDDSITVRELERQLLENRGYAVDIAVDGLDGWNAVRGGDYQLVISDVDMPRMDGIEFVRSIKRDPRLKSLPVVIVSYKDREEDRLRGLEAGADCYLTKSSFHDQTFLTTVSDLIGEATDGGM
jgi:two-component system sensor histidine kinase and response regulator WspE